MLSDSCDDFLEAVLNTAKEHAGMLAEAVENYSGEPFDYGEEIDGLRTACRGVTEPNAFASTSPIVALIQLAEAVSKYHWTPPHSAEAQERFNEMIRLYRSVKQIELINKPTECNVS